MLVGTKVFATSDMHDIEGVIVAGFNFEGTQTYVQGDEISLDDVVSIKADDDGKVYRCNGWLWSFDKH
jgi:hypothetical protein